MFASALGALSPLAIVVSTSTQIPPATPMVVSPGSVGVSPTAQLEHAVQIARWVGDDLDRADLWTLELDSATRSSLLPEAHRRYLALGEPVGTGVGSEVDPVLIGDDARGLADAIDDAVASAQSTGKLAIFIDNAVDTSSAAVPVQVPSPIGSSLDLLHVFAWDRTGLHPDRLPVIDAFRPLQTFAATGSTWQQVSAGSGVFAIDLSPDAEQPVLFRIGAAGQHVHDDGFFFETTPDAIVSSQAAWNEFAYETATRLLVRLASAADPADADLRAALEPEAFLSVFARRAYVSGLRVSGYGSSAASPDRYCIFFGSQPDSLQALERVRADFSTKHVLGMAGGGTSTRVSRFATLDTQYGFGYDNGNGYTAGVSFSLSGWPSLTESRPTFVGGTTGARDRGQATFLHVGQAGSTGARVVVDASISTGTSSLSFGGHADKDPDYPPFDFWFAPSMEVEQQLARAVGNPWLGQNVAYGRVRTAYPFATPRPFQAVSQLVGPSFTNMRRTSLTLEGPMAPFASTHRRWMITTNDDHAIDPVVITLDESSFDASALGSASGSVYLLSSESRVRAAAGVVSLINIRDSVVRVGQRFRWFRGVPSSDPDFMSLADFTGSVFVGNSNPSQIPPSATVLSEDAWAATDPATLHEGLATAWLVDQAGLQAAASSLARARLVGDAVTATPVTHLPAGSCIVGVAAVSQVADPSDAALLSGSLGFINPGLGGTVSIASAAPTDDLYLYILHAPSGLIREPLLLRPGTSACAADVNGDGTVDADDLYAQTIAPIDVNGDGVIDQSDRDCLMEHLRRDEIARMAVERR